MRKRPDPLTILCFACAAYVLVSVIIFAASTSYSVILADDLGIRYTGRKSMRELIGLAAANDYHNYMHWQGTYFTKFVEVIFHPMYGAGVSQLGITMVFNALLFFVTLLFLLYEIHRMVYPSGYRRYPVFAAMFLFTLLNIQSYAEVFFYYAAALSFSVPMSFANLSLGFALKRYRSEKKAYTALAAVTAFCAAGGTLMVAGALCWLLLLLCIRARFKKHSSFRACVTVWAVSFAGALINTLAPGNFVRRGVVSDSRMSALSAGIATLKYGYLEIEKLFSDTLLTAVLLIVLALGIWAHAEAEKRIALQRIKYSAAALLAPLIALFPMELGNDGAGIPGRGAFIFDLTLLLALLPLVFFTGQYAAWFFAGEKKSALLFLLAVQLVLVLSLNNVTVLTAPQYVMARNLAEGAYRDYYMQIQDIMYTLETGTEPDPVLTLPEDLEQYQNFILSTDPDYYVNHTLAFYYGKKSVRAAE